jgi:hypothetical protein
MCAAVGAGIVVAIVTGCTPGGVGTATPPTAADSATPTPTPTPTAAAAPFVISCTTIVPTERFDFLTATAGELTPSADFIAKARTSPSPGVYPLMEDNGGIMCPWSTGSEYGMAYGYAPLFGSQADEVGALIDDGSDTYTVSSYSGGILYESGTAGNAFAFFLVYPDSVFVATTTEFLDEMRTKVP